MKMLKGKKAQSGGQSILLVIILIAFIISGILAVLNKLPLFDLSIRLSGNALSIFMNIFARFIVAPALVGVCLWAIYHLIKGR